MMKHRSVVKIMNAENHITSIPPQKHIETFCEEVNQLARSALDKTSLKFLLSNSTSWLSSGKMLRCRLTAALSPTSPQPRGTLLAAATAVEMVHAASLLHDDVIDGGYLRRNEPSFWVERGIPGAILVGDLLLFKALELTCSTEHTHLTRRLVELTGEVCMAESEQELVHRGIKSSWDVCVSIARRKTGALFAFAAYSGADSDHSEQAEALTEAGYELGTAYQLSDDILDATGSDHESGKTLGTDEHRNKVTAMRVLDAPGGDPAAHVEALVDQSIARLEPWPQVRDAWVTYCAQTVRPALQLNLEGLTGHRA